MGRRKKGQPPQMRHNKNHGSAYVEINGERTELGPWGSPEAARAFRNVISAWERAQMAQPATHAATTGAPTVAELVSAFLKHAKVHYRRSDGSLTDEPRAFARSLLPVLRAHGKESPDDFECLDLEAIVAGWVKDGHCRETCNKMAGRIKHVFKWGVSKKFVSALSAAALVMTPSLKSGRCGAPDYQEVSPVPIRHLAAVLIYCRREKAKVATGWNKWAVVEAMVRTAYLCGARQSEVLKMSATDIHKREIRVGKRTVSLPAGVWAFVPGWSKTKGRGKFVRYLIGPRLQRILQPWIDKAQGGYLFPAAKMPFMDSGVWNGYLEDACLEMGVPKWSPGMLRHSYLTRVERIAGIHMANSMVSHATLAITAGYVERDLPAAAKLAEKIG